MIDKNEARRYPNRYESLIKNKVAAIDKRTGEKVFIDIDVFYKEKDKYCGITKGKIKCYDIEMEKYLPIDKEEYHKLKFIKYFPTKDSKYPFVLNKENGKRLKVFIKILLKIIINIFY